MYLKTFILIVLTVGVVKAEEEFKCYSCLSFTKDTCKKEEKVCKETERVCLEVDYKDMGYVLQCADMDYYHGAVEDCEEFGCEVSLCTTPLCNA